jgi:type IV secretion system protein TrbL
MAFPSLTNILRTFAQTFDSGRLSLFPDVQTLFSLLVAIEVALAGVYLAIGANAGLVTAARKILQVGFIYYTIQHYDDLLKVVLDGFLHAGRSTASATNIDIATFRDPDRVFAAGMRLTEPALRRIAASTQESYLGIPSFDSILVALCTLIGLFAIAVMAIQIFVTYLEYLLVSAVGFVLLPFAVFKPLAFLTQKLFGAIIGLGIKLMVLALIIAVSVQILEQSQATDEITWQQSFDFVLVSLALCYLSIHAPALCQTLFSGSPILTASAVTPVAAGSAATAGALMAATGYTGAKAISAAAGAMNRKQPARTSDSAPKDTSPQAPVAQVN